MEENNKHFVKSMWVIVIVGILVVIGLSIYSAVGLNYNFPDMTTLLPL